jgi:hypothetical protein
MYVAHGEVQTLRTNTYCNININYYIVTVSGGRLVGIVLLQTKATEFIVTVTAT